MKVLTGESVVSPEMTSKLVSALRQTRAAPSPLSAAPDVPGVALGKGDEAGLADELSARELGILRLIARGDSNKVIARELDIAETTVKIHVQHILRKLKVTSRVQAAVYAVHHGLH
jgi:two-component system nitrate/nitrite response regulator NarL